MSSLVTYLLCREIQDVTIGKWASVQVPYWDVGSFYNQRCVFCRYSVYIYSAVIHFFDIACNYWIAGYVHM